MNDFDSKTMQIVIDYIYTGEFPKEKYLDISLLIAADFLCEEELRRACEAFLETIIDLDNIVEILTTSFTYNAPNLRKSAMAFVCENMKAVKDLPEWKNLHVDHPKILSEIMEVAFD